MLSPIWHDSRKCSYFCGSWLNIWRQIGWFLQAGCSTSYTIVPDADMIPGDSQSEGKIWLTVPGISFWIFYFCDYFCIFVKICLLPVPGMAEQLETFLGEPEQVLPSISYHIISSISLPYHFNPSCFSSISYQPYFPYVAYLPYHINHLPFHTISTQPLIKSVRYHFTLLGTEAHWHFPLILTFAKYLTTAASIN